MSDGEDKPVRLSEREWGRSRFDSFGEAASRVTSQGAFFAGCLGIAAGLEHRA